jgi:hypothetical protein
MAKRFLTPIRIANLSSDPQTANEGDLYYNTVSDTLKVYANSVWAEVGAGGGSGGGSVTVSTTAPVSPTQGDLWFDSENANTYIYYDSTWVQITGSDGLVPTIFYQPSSPTSPTIGDIWVDSDEPVVSINSNDFVLKSDVEAGLFSPYFFMGGL